MSLPDGKVDSESHVGLDSESHGEVDRERLAALPPLPRDDGGPVFAAPWQAQAFALAVKLSEQGHFTWKEWAAALGAELKAAEDRGEPDDGSRYYVHWVAALERLVTEKGLADHPRLAERKEAWADAYRHTPHGQPVVLRDRRSVTDDDLLPNDTHTSAPSTHPSEDS